MDLQEATLALARFMKVEKDFYDQHLKARRPKNAEELKVLEELTRQFEIYRARTRQFANILAADSAFFDIVESWVVAVQGKEAVSRKSMVQYQDNADVEELISLASNLASSVKGFIRSAGYFIADMGVGDDGWDLGVRCTHKDAKELCNLLHRKYSKAINLNLLIVSRKFGEHKLPGLYNYEDAERIIRIYGEPNF